jgi:tetratricopeptide (TPR) repeat protein
MAGADPDQSPASRPVALKTIIEAHLAKILSSGVFKTSDSLRKLLRFTVNETLSGRGGDLKEYLLGTTVLERGDSFDPKADPIVRMQMRRLREHLSRYYATEGRYDPVVIEIPKGTYIPTFRAAARDAVIAAPAGTEERLIVGREKELINLRAAFESAASGQEQLLCLIGEPGIGKTTIVETFLHELGKSGREIYFARGRCSERLAGSEAYLPVLEVLDSLFRGGEESLGRVMSTVAPAWYVQMGPFSHDAATDSVEPACRVGSQECLKRELVALLEELARRQPVVLFLDDLHWADASTIDILAYAATRCASQRILIVAAYRPADLFATDHPFLRVKLELQGHGICREIPMQFLTRTDVDRYLALRFPEHLFPPELSTRIHERTEGNPLFMADLVRFMRDRGVFVQHKGRWVVRGQLSGVEHELPESVRSMVEKKIGQLRGADRRLLVAASVQGYEFDSAVLSRALGVDAAEVEERLDVLERVHGFVRLVGEQEFPDRTLTMRYRFVHVLYQNALYESLQPTRKASLSAAVAEALLAYVGTHHSAIAPELAILFEAARDFERAAEYFLLAAEQATRVAANTEVVVLARRGLDALMMLPETPERAQRELRLRTTLGPALMSTVGWGAPEVEAIYLRARDLCQQIGDAPQLFPVIYGLWGYWHGRAEYQTAVGLGEQLLALAQKVQDPTLLLLGHYSLGNTLAVLGDWDRSRTHIEQAIPLYDPEQHQLLASVYGGHDPGVVCRSGLPINLWMLGYPDQALQKAADGITLAREITHNPSVVFALIFDAMFHLHRLDTQQGRKSAEAAIALATEQELAPLSAWARVLRGSALVEQGTVVEGIAQLRDGMAGWRTMGLVFRPHFLFLLAKSHARIGQIEEALATLSEALAVTEQTHEGFVEPELHRLNGELQCDPREAEACFHRAIEIARRQKAKLFELRAVVSLSRRLQKEGRQAEARGMLSDIYGWFTEGFDTADLKEAATLLEHLGVATAPMRDVEASPWNGFVSS